MTKEEILTEMEYLRKKNEHWKSCQDGSYEMALHESGYDRLRKMLEDLEEEV